LNKIALIRAIINWVVNFITDYVAPWIIERGGWVSFFFALITFIFVKMFYTCLYSKMVFNATFNTISVISCSFECIHGYLCFQWKL